MVSLQSILPAALAVCALTRAQEMGEPGEVVGESSIGEMGDTFTVPQSEFTAGTTSCSSAMAGCTGTFVNGAAHDVEGVITVIDDCTFEISNWQFDGIGPAVEWWASMQDAAQNLFPYPTNAQKIGELGAPGSYQTGSDHGGDSEVVVRLGKDAAGSQILLSPALNHISLWCEEFKVDFGNAALSCPSAEAPEVTTMSDDYLEPEDGEETADATAVPPATPEEASGAGSTAAVSLVAAVVGAAAVAVM